jgi:hypothetical protein
MILPRSPVALQPPGYDQNAAIVEFPCEKIRGYALMVVSGYKAGLVYSYLPQGPFPLGGGGYAVNVSWLKLNLAVLGYFDCPLDEVYLLNRLPPLRL